VYGWVPLIPKSELTLEQKASRLAVFCEAYGSGIDAEAVLDILPIQLRYFAGVIQADTDRGDRGFLKLVGWNVPARIRDYADVIERQAPTLHRR
jgi:hypothetical protein